MNSISSLRFTNNLFAPVSIAWLIIFRIAFGGILLWEVFRYFTKNWIYRYWIEPKFHFKYFGFEWVEPLPGPQMHLLWFMLGMASMCIMLGLFYRISVFIFLFGFTYCFLLEQARYLNHFYFVILVCFLMVLVPAHHAFSLDSLRKPKIKSNTCPIWSLYVLRVQLGIVYCYAGLSKLNYDWLHGKPFGYWLSKRTDFPIIGNYFTEEWVILSFCYGGLLFDLLIVFFLLYKRTRVIAFIVAVLFHLTNAFLFKIGIFPWFAMAMTTIFFAPNWPVDLIQKFSFFKTDGLPDSSVSDNPNQYISTIKKKILLTVLVCFIAIQLLVPFRHFLYPGNVSWTEEGHLFSWHMKLRSKSTDIRFYIKDVASGREWFVDTKKYLKSWQSRKMGARPELILQFAHYLQKIKNPQNDSPVEVRVSARCGLNGREKQYLIDPKADLTKIKSSLFPANWIVPLKD
ncbi:MAG: vitamin K-dependent gamma-carboxylase [Planctomycetota bacterium]|nr:MAG: vitamin K-dependent gamma-carboxylase [Planctomycetota bacterium]